MKLKSIVLAAALLTAIAGAAQAQIKERSIKIGTGITEDHPQALSLKHFAEAIEAKSGGKMKAKVFANGTLGNDVTMTSALRGGTLEMTIPDSSTLVSIVKDFGVLNLPMTFNNEQEADAVLDSAFGQKLLDKLPEKGLIGLAYFENGFRHVSNSRRPIAKAEDMVGLKLRVIQSPLFIDTFTALGANATPLPFTELYSAMEQKAVDGQENPAVTILTSKFYEVQKQMVLSKHAGREATAFERKSIRALNEKALGELKKVGMNITELPAPEQAKMREKLQPVVAKYSKEFGEDTTREMMAELEKARKK
jgi:tripartite ATP-independent transporter DctP family solute receptor